MFYCTHIFTSLNKIKKWHIFVSNIRVRFFVLHSVKCKMQPLSLRVENVDKIYGMQPIVRRHGPLLPNSVRCIICGPSGCGKTNVLIALLENPNGLCFENVYIYSKTLEQDKYRYLKSILSNIKGLGYYAFSANDDVIPPSKAKPNSIFIFDDVICDRQSNIRAYFCMARHRSIDCFYLAQSYTRIPKHLIRDNANFVILFKQDDTNLRHVFNDCGIGCDMTFDSFREMCNMCWREKYGFAVIDMESSVNAGRYRRGFDHFAKL